jgi:MFS family permease
MMSLCLIGTEFQEQRTRAPRSLRSEMREGLAWLWRHPLLRFIALLTGGLNLCSIGSGLLVIVLAQHLHAGPAAIGLIVAAGAVGSAVGALAAAPLQKRLGIGPIIASTVGIFVLLWPLYVLAPTPILLGAVSALRSTVGPIYMVAHRSYRLAVVPDELQGRVTGVFTLIAWGSQPLGLAVAGVLLQVLGPVPMVLLLFVPQTALAGMAAANPHVRRARLPQAVERWPQTTPA